MEDSIRLIDLTTGYKGKPVTRNINACLKAGTFTCLLGPNGAGKSTLLKTLSAFLPPLEGEIEIFGKDARQFNTREMAQTIGVVLTDRPQTMNMTVEELVAVGRSPYTSFFGGLKEKDREVVDEAIAQVGIDALRSRSVSTLSDGERQKTLIAKALAQQTPIIFLDEPTAFLDYPSKVEIMRLLLRIAHDEEKTVFMSTHDLELAIKLADSLWLLDKQQGLSIGSPQELAQNGLIAAYFERPGLVFEPASLSFLIQQGL